MKKIITILLLLLCIKVKASIVVMDYDSKRVLYSNNENEKKLIASTTKIMTSIIALENSSLDKKIKIGKEINSVNGSMLYIHENEEFTLNDLLHGLMLQSGNDAAMSIASNVMEYNEFIASMNMKAYKLGMYNTTFENPHGLNDDTKNYSTAYDLALLMTYAIKNKDFVNITRCKKYSVQGYTWYNKNKLLTDYKYLISGKIGYTTSSGQVYVSASTKDNKTLVIASINESDKFNLHKKLYEEYFNKYKKYQVLDKNTFFVNNKNNDNYYILNDYYMLLKDNEKDNIKIEVHLNNDSNYLNVIYDDKIIHTEKIYKEEYKKRINYFKQILSFFK